MYTFVHISESVIFHEKEKDALKDVGNFKKYYLKRKESMTLSYYITGQKGTYCSPKPQGGCYDAHLPLSPLRRAGFVIYFSLLLRL